MPADPSDRTNLDPQHLRETTRHNRPVQEVEPASRASVDQTGSRLLEEQREQWARGQRVRVEDYLAQFPHLASEEETLLDLIYNEFDLREGMEESPSPAEYLKRFPHLASRLERLFSVHMALKQFSSETENKSLEPDPEPAPASIGKYIVVASLGSIDQADLFRVFHPEMNRELILKWGQQPLADQPDAGARFEKLGQTLRAIHHQNLGRVHDVGLVEGRPFLVLDYCRGVHLEQHALVHPSLPPEAARRVALLARAVGVLHRAGLVHQHLRPRSVLIDEAGEPRLIDFGLGPFVPPAQDPRAMREAAGVLPWLAPEQARGETTLSPACDVFALGAILHLLLTGRAPYPRDSGSALLERCRRGEWDRSALQAPEIPPELAALCASALDPVPVNRPASGDALAEALEACLRPRSRLPFVALAAAVLMGLGVLGWVLFGR